MAYKSELSELGRLSPDGNFIIPVTVMNAEKRNGNWRIFWAYGNPVLLQQNARLFTEVLLPLPQHPKVKISVFSHFRIATMCNCDNSEIKELIKEYVATDYNDTINSGDC